MIQRQSRRRSFDPPAPADNTDDVPGAAALSPRPLIVAHRGACGYLPEQTLPAFQLAIEQGADAIELDVVPTRDGILLARHESELSLTTNVEVDPRFSGRRTTQRIGGASVSGWFSTDFTFEQVSLLGARQRMPFRDHSHDDEAAVPSLDEVLELARSRKTQVFIEVKDPEYFASLGFAINQLLRAALDRHGLRRRDCGAVIQSFSSKFLRAIRGETELPIIQLLDRPGFDLDEIATYADGIGPWKRLIVPAPADEDGVTHHTPPRLLPATTLVAAARDRGLYVSTWTFRDEPRFLAADYGVDPVREYHHFMALGVDAITTDFPDTAVRARELFASRQAQI